MSLLLDVWSDYVCPFCYLEEPILNRMREEFGDQLTVRWRAFELRPEPVPTLPPHGEYLVNIWERAVYPMARERGMKLQINGELLTLHFRLPARKAGLRAGLSRVKGRPPPARE